MSWLKKLSHNDKTQKESNKGTAPAAPQRVEEMLAMATRALAEFAAAHYGTNLRWSVNIEELYALSRNGWQKDIPTHGAVLDLLQTPEILVQVTANGPQEYMVRVLTEKKLPNDPVSGFSPVASKTVPAKGSSLRMALEEFVKQRVMPQR